MKVLKYPQSKSYIPVALLSLALVFGMFLSGTHQTFANNLWRVSFWKQIRAAPVMHLASIPDNPNLARMVGHAYLEAGHTDVAVALLTHATSGSQAPLAYFDLCTQAWDAGRTEEALADCKAGGIPAQVWIDRGVQFVASGNQDEAIRAYRFAVDLEPEWHLPHQRLADLLKKQARYDEIIQLLEPWIQRHPDASPDPYHQLGNAYWKLGQSGRALQFLLEGNRRFPDAPAIHLFFAYIFEDTGDLDSAAKWYDSYLEQNPRSHITIFLKRAKIAEILNDPETAIELYRQAIAIDPENINAWIGLGRSAKAIRNNTLAKQAFSQALALDPNNKEANQELNTLQDNQH